MSDNTVKHVCTLENANLGLTHTTDGVIKHQIEVVHRAGLSIFILAWFVIGVIFAVMSK